MNNITLPPHVNIIEVGPRDGLQNEAIVDTHTKIALINQLSETGLSTIEAGSFVSSKRIPQMADSTQVLSLIQRHASVSYSALTPNLTGFNHALHAHVDQVSVFTSASECFCRNNINCTIAESIERFKPVLHAARQRNVPVRAYLSCVIDCPYEGATSPTVVAKLVKKLIDLGCYQVSLGDTIGTGTPMRVAKMLYSVAEEVPFEMVAVHFHDTWGQALTNIYQALRIGVTTIDSSVAGLGGCPYAKGSAGNVATEDVLYLCHELGIKTGVDLLAVAKAGWSISDTLGRPPSSKVSLALRAQESNH